MTGLAISLVVQASLLTGGGEEYAAAYRQTHADGQPLVVLVGADWCPGCRTMKLSVLPRLQQSGKLRSVHLAHVNMDEQSELASQLMRGGTIPQLIVFVKTAEGWHREQITGAVDEGSVEALIRRAGSLQVASPPVDNRIASEAGGN